MKKIQFFLVAAVAIMFAACSNDDVVLTDTGSSTGSYSGGDGYVAVSISVPDQISTRAADDTKETNNGDGFYAGSADEYAISDATLLLFAGATESAAKFYAIYPLYITSSNTGNDQNITLTKSVVREIDLPDDSSADIYGLVVLNRNSLLTYDGEGKWGAGASNVYFGNSTTKSELTSNTGISDLQTAMAITADESEFRSHGFFMTNAPLYASKGGTKDPTTLTSSIDPEEQSAVLTLAPLNKGRIHSSEAEASKNSSDPALIVYVERALAKVTVEERTGGVQNKIDNTSTSTTGNLQDVKVSLNGYILDVTNKQTNFVRDAASKSTVSGLTSYEWWGYRSWYKTTHASAYSGADMSSATASAYRFVGDSSVGENAGTDVDSNDGTALIGNSTLYRTYWAKDPNYNTYTYSATNQANNFNVYTNTYVADDNDLQALSSTGYSYCLENTFDLEHQLQDETTRLIIQAQFTLNSTADADAEDFYTVNDDSKTVYPATEATYTEGTKSVKFESITDYIKENIIEESDAIAKYAQYYTDEDAFWANIIVTMPITSDIPSTDVDFIVTWNGTNPTTNWTGATDAGFDPSSQDSYDTQFKAILATAVANLNTSNKIAYYPQGKCYYPVRIMHFGDDLTPWYSEDLTAKYGSSTDIYPATGLEDNASETAEGDWLGRYGVLRNNWYDIVINSVTGLGTPLIPELTIDEDDEIHTYIKCRIKQLSWRYFNSDTVLQ